MDTDQLWSVCVWGNKPLIPAVDKWMNEWVSEWVTEQTLEGGGGEGNACQTNQVGTTQ